MKYKSGSYHFLLPLVFLAGCTTVGDRIDQIREQADKCDGTVKVEVTKTAYKENLLFTCVWTQNEPETT